MPSVTTQGIVLRHADYREHDRMLTLLTPLQGRVEALCRGCRRLGSPLLPASEFFTMGEYVLYTGKGRMTVTSFKLVENFYPLRMDWDRLRYASYLLSVAEAAAQPGERSLEHFTLLARSLSRLAYGDHAYKAVSAAYLLHFSSVSGYRPRLSHCVRCGKPMPDDAMRVFDIENGGPVCSSCAEALDGLLPVRPEEILWMRDVLRIGIEKTSLPDADAPFFLLSRYAEARLEKAIRHTGLY